MNECVCMVVATGRHGRLQYSSNRRASEWQGNSLQLAQVSRLLGASQWIGGVGAGDLVEGHAAPQMTSPLQTLTILESSSTAFAFSPPDGTKHAAGENGSSNDQHSYLILCRFTCSRRRDPGGTNATRNLLPPRRFTAPLWWLKMLSLRLDRVLLRRSRSALHYPTIISSSRPSSAVPRCTTPSHITTWLCLSDVGPRG